MDFLSFALSPFIAEGGNIEPFNLQVDVYNEACVQQIADLTTGALPRERALEKIGALEKYIPLYGRDDDGVASSRLMVLATAKERLYLADDLVRCARIYKSGSLAEEIVNKSKCEPIIDRGINNKKKCDVITEGFKVIRTHFGWQEK